MLVILLTDEAGTMNQNSGSLKNCCEYHPVNVRSGASFKENKKKNEHLYFEKELNFVVFESDKEE